VVDGELGIGVRIRVRLGLGRRPVGRQGRCASAEVDRAGRACSHGHRHHLPCPPGKLLAYATYLRGRVPPRPAVEPGGLGWHPATPPMATGDSDPVTTSWDLAISSQASLLPTTTPLPATEWTLALGPSDGWSFDESSRHVSADVTGASCGLIPAHSVAAPSWGYEFSNNPRRGLATSLDRRRRPPATVVVTD